MYIGILVGFDGACEEHMKRANEKIIVFINIWNIYRSEVVLINFMN